MRLVKKAIPINRRSFIGGATGAAILGGFAAQGEAASITLATVSETQAAETLVKMARDLYPHDRIPDLYYVNAISTIDGEIAAADGDQTLLEHGAGDLDAEAERQFGSPYQELSGEADRVQVLKSLEGSAFFTRVRSGMVTALYNQPEVWTLLGYEGSSFEQGGYLERGFDDIDWLDA
ncbi:MAG: Twin-arginine translocation pathway signal [Novosphingobium sp.]|nr:Twin-arginine translocation pathway signal [Novosphingobium sp.]